VTTLALAPVGLRESYNDHAQRLPEQVSYGPHLDASDPSTFNETTFEQDEESREVVTNATRLVEVGFNSLTEAGDIIAAEGIFTEAQQNVRRLNPFVRVAVGRLVIGSLAHVELARRAGVEAAADVPPIGLAVIRRQVELVDSAFMEAKRDGYVAGREAINLRLYVAAVETAVPAGNLHYATRLARDARMDFHKLSAQGQDSDWQQSASAKFERLQKLRETVQSHLRPTPREWQKNAQTGLSIVDDLPLPYICESTETVEDTPLPPRSAGSLFVGIWPVK
jgi:hypothetical protein